jgi:purine-binding chemotaxis protein CheW
MDLIVARDVLSFMNPKQQTGLIGEFTEKLKDNGIVILGKNEAMPQHSGWLRSVQGDVVAFSKE